MFVVNHKESGQCQNWHMSIFSFICFYKCVLSLLGSEAHAEAGQVSVGEGEDDHEDDVPGVVGEQNGEVLTRLDITQHEQRDEDDPQTHQDRKPPAVLTGLEREREKHSNISHRDSTWDNNDSIRLSMWFCSSVWILSWFTHWLLINFLCA